MTKQEEIRGGIARQVFIWHIGRPEMWDKRWDESGHFPSWEGPPREDYFEAADMVMKEEHSQGVVIKVDKVYPSSEGCLRPSDYMDKLHRAGFVAVEPLIKEK